MNVYILKMLIILFYVGVLIVNYLSNAIPFNNNTQTDISEKFPSYFTPTGFTFSIWGIIYIMLGVFVVRMALQDATFFEQGYVTVVIIWFIISCILNMVWLVAWHYLKMEFSMIVMLGLLVSVLVIWTKVPTSELLFKTTFSIYAGWISIATIANATILLVKLNIPVFQNNQVQWFVAVITIGFLLVATVLNTTTDILYALVFIWAYYGIIMKHIHHENPFISTKKPIIYLQVLFVLIVLLTSTVFVINGFQLYI